MGGFIDATIRIEKRKLGDFVEDLAFHIPYARYVGHRVAIPSERFRKNINQMPSEHTHDSEHADAPEIAQIGRAHV